jgi:hypothetical protein
MLKIILSICPAFLRINSNTSYPEINQLSDNLSILSSQFKLHNENIALYLVANAF